LEGAVKGNGKKALLLGTGKLGKGKRGQWGELHKKACKEH